MRKNLDDAVAKALESLNVKLTPFAELDKMVHSRQRLKLDFDHYSRKVGQAHGGVKGYIAGMQWNRMEINGMKWNAK